MSVSLLTQIAMQAIGTRYRWGGQNILEGLDCSGFARYLLRSVGELPFEDMTAQGIHDYLASNSRQVMTEGSLVFFGNGLQRINHVAYCVNTTLMVEAFGDSTVKTPEDARLYRSNEGAMVRMYPINRRLDLQACLRPVYRNLGES